MPTKIMGFSINVNDEEVANERTEMGLDSAGRGILYLLEEYTQYAYKAPNKEFTKVVSIRKACDPKGVGFATMPPITNIYDNNIPILED